MRSFLLASCTCAALIVPAGRAVGQDRVFINGVFELTAALEGTFGDEGAMIGPALDRLGQALAEWDRAIRIVEGRVAAASASPRATVDLRLALARMYAERGRHTDALRELDAVTSIEPRRADALVLRGLVLEASSRATEADKAFHAAWLIEPDNPVTAYYVARHTTTARDPEDLERARNILSAAYRRRIAEAARPTVLPFVRVSLLQQASSSEPVLPLARYARGYARLAAGDYAGALDELRRAATADPLVTDPATRSLPLMRAVGALREGRLAEARALLDGVNVPAGSSEAHRIRGLIDWASEDYDKSLEQLTVAVQSNPGDERSRLARARVLTSAGRHAEAERALLDTLHAVPDSALAHWWLGLGYEGLNRRADARRAIEQAATSAIAGRSSLYGAIGRLAAVGLDVPAAVEAFRRAVDANPNHPAAHTSLASALLQQDRADDAFVEFVAALLIDPLDAGAFAGIGRIHLDAGRYSDAVEALQRAVDSAPDDAEARYALATALMRSGRSQDAAPEFDRVEDAQRRTVTARRRTMSVEVLKEEAALHVAEGRYDRAVELYEQAVARGRDPDVYRQLAELYAKLGRTGDAARARALSRMVVQ